MHNFRFLNGVILWLVAVAVAHGHGTPIHVEVASNKLVVGQGLVDTLGYASQMFVEDDEDGDPFGEVSLPTIGPVVIWQIPGFDIFGMNNDSSLSLEVLRRPVAGSSPLQHRTLWYWNDQTELVEPPSGDSMLHLLARDNQSVALSLNDLSAPAPLLLADTLTGQLGFHNHGLLSYVLDNDPAPPSGTYGFFARLTSNGYLPSEPFLVVLNRNTDYSQMIPAALAINAAAVASAPIPGDYDDNHALDANDYVFWRERFGKVVTPLTSPDGNGNGIVDAADYVVWRNSVTMGSGAAGSQSVSTIPEPANLTLALCGAVFCWRGFVRRRVS